MQRLTAFYRTPPARRALLVASGVAAGVLAWRWLLPPPALTDTGFSLVLDHLFSLALSGLLLLTAWGVGSLVLRQLQAKLRLEGLLETVLALALGLGALSLVVFGLGAAGLFRRAVLAAVLLATFVLLSPEWFAAVSRAAFQLRQAFARLGTQSALVKLSLIAAAVTAVMATLQALTPPWTFDALMYHLEAPARYFEHGRLLLLPDLWQANGPLAIEMLYAFGLAFGSASFARLTHLLLTTLLVLATFAFGSRWLGRRAAYLAVLLLLGIPIFPIWGSIANIDSGWALYEFVGLACLICWLQSGDRGWSRLAGAALGMAMATKYVALAALLPAGLLLAIRFANADRRRWLADVAGLAGLAALFAGPWYLLNLVRAGNPVYPFVLGGPGWDADRLQFLTSYLGSFGHPNKFVSLLFAPVWLYSRNELYASFMSSIEYPSFLFPLAFLTPIFRHLEVIKLVASVALLRFIMWGLTSQQTRFLLPLMPMLAVLSAVVMLNLGRTILRDHIRGTLIAGMIGGLLGVTIFFQAVLWQTTRPEGVLLGYESSAGFLRRNSATFPAQEFIVTQLPDDARVLMIYEGEAFYCDRRCVADSEQSLWTQLHAENQTQQSLTNALSNRGYTHLLARTDSLNFFLAHDPTGEHASAIHFYLNVYRHACSVQVFSSESIVIDELVCGV